MAHRLALLALAVLPSTALAQRNFGGAFGCTDLPSHAVQYDGRFTFARLKYNGGPGNCYYRGEPSWAHGYGYTNHGTAESNLLRISADVSAFHPHLDETAVVDVGDPALLHYPVAFMVEGAYLTLTDKEAANLHRYLMKGGFLIVDDFREDHPLGVRSRAAGLSRHLREQRSDAAVVGDDQLQHRHLAVLGILVGRVPSNQRFERGVQDRGELSDLRPHSLSTLLK